MVCAIVTSDDDPNPLRAKADGQSGLWLVFQLPRRHRQGCSSSLDLYCRCIKTNHPTIVGSPARTPGCRTTSCNASAGERQPSKRRRKGSSKGLECNRMTTPASRQRNREMINCCGRSSCHVRYFLPEHPGSGHVRNGSSRRGMRRPQSFQS